jgi:hypothetical protein
MVTSTPRSTGGVLLLLVCVALILVAGCKTETSSAGRPMMRLADVREPDWKPLTGARVASAETPAINAPSDTENADLGSASGADLRMIDAARGDLRRRVRELAEGQIARETVDLRESVNALADERISELTAENKRDYQELAEKAAANTSLRARDIEMEFQPRSLDLRVKLSALNARRGLFGGTIDAQAQSKAQLLQAQLADLEKHRQSKIQALREADELELSELSKKQQATVAAETARLHGEAEAKIAGDTRERRDRLSADLSQGESEDPPGTHNNPVVSKVTSNRLTMSNRRAAYTAEGRFNSDLAAARASARKRQEEIRRREQEDLALMGRR